MTHVPMITNVMIEKYIADRGGHDSKCCFFNQGYGCNCRAGEWGDPFRAGFNLAMHSISQPADCRKCGGTRLVKENSGRPVPCDLCPSQPADDVVERFKPYLFHPSGCRIWHPKYRENGCDCGLDELLAKINAVLSKEPDNG